jgi:hypothetical protein
MSEAQGIVAVCTDPEGHVIASVSDFDPCRYGGFTRRQAQEYRASRALHRAVVAAYCSDRITPFIDEHDAQRIANSMERKGWRFTRIPVGYDDDGE